MAFDGVLRSIWRSFHAFSQRPTDSIRSKRLHTKSLEREEHKELGSGDGDVKKKRMKFSSTTFFVFLGDLAHHCERRFKSRESPFSLIPPALPAFVCTTPSLPAACSISSPCFAPGDMRIPCISSASRFCAESRARSRRVPPRVDRAELAFVVGRVFGDHFGLRVQRAFLDFFHAAARAHVVRRALRRRAWRLSEP